MPKREKNLAKKCLDWLNIQDHCIGRKRVLMYATTGDADLYGSIHGTHFEVELKVPGENATKLHAGAHCADIGISTSCSYDLHMQDLPVLSIYMHRSTGRSNVPLFHGTRWCHLK